MLNLICGPAVTISRQLLLSRAASENTLFIVPDDLSAAALSRELFRGESGVVTEQKIITFDAMLQRITAFSIDSAQTVPQEIVRAVVRNIIDTEPAAFDHLVGKHSVPYMSQGVLDRIVSGMTKVRKKIAGSEEEAEIAAVSPREHQLTLLAAKFEQRLVPGGYRQLEHARLEALANVSNDVWENHFSAVKTAVFLDFISHTDITYMLVHAVSRNVSECTLTLDFDPEQEGSGSAMDSAYQRYYDMADKLILSPEDLPDVAQGPSQIESDTAQPIVINANTVAQEIHGAAASIRRLLDDAPNGDKPSIVVALPNWNDYAPALEKELEHFAIDAVWRESEQVVRGGEFLLLDRIRRCSDKAVSGSDVSTLFRAPGFPVILQDTVPSVEAWDLASRLDYVLTLTGQLQGWRAIISSVQMVLQSIQIDRKRQNQWSDEEATLDLRLVELLKQTQATLKTFGQKAPVEDWCRQVVSVFRQVADGEDHNSDDLSDERRSELKRLLHNTARFGTLISSAPVSFSYFLTLYKSVCYNARVGNQEKYQSRPVTVCSLPDAGKIRSNCCLVLGCNDGNFPQFAKPDAAFLGYNFQTNQASSRAHQRIVLEQILRSHARVLLWMPQRVGTEELLPSQFIEELLSSGRCSQIGLEGLLTAMKASTYGLGRQLQQELVQSLKGLVLTPGELQRFAQRGRLMFNIASNMSVLASRSQAQLSGYDGIITDPHLKNWLARWSERHIYSVSQLDSVVGCSFRFFVDRMLHLEELEETDDLLPAHLFGSFTHDVLARFYRDWVAGGRGVPRPDDEPLAREKLLEAYYIEHEKFPDASDFARDLLNLKLFGDLGADGFGSTDRTLDSVNDSGVIGQFLQMEMARGGDPAMDFLKPSNFEVGFGMGRLQEDDPLTLPEHLKLDLGHGETIKLRGRIDRIDIASTGTFAVTDYKTGRLPEKREILGGYRTQLPVYMLVGEQLLAGKVQDPEAAGGLYYSLRKGVNTKVSGVFFRAAYQKQAGVSGRGLKDDEFRETLEKVKSHMRHSLKAVREGYLTSTRHNPETVCRYCPFEGFCYRDVERTASFWESLEGGAEEPVNAY